MPRVLENTQRLKDPARYYVELWNNGEYRCYDSVTKAQVNETDLSNGFLYVDRTFFKYKDVIDPKTGKKEYSYTSSEYRRLSDLLKIYKDDGFNTPSNIIHKDTVESLKDTISRLQLSTGCYIYALSTEDSELYRFELTSTGMYSMINFRKEVNQQYGKVSPDFIFKGFRPKEKNDPKTCAKIIPMFSFFDYEFTEGDLILKDYNRLRKDLNTYLDSRQPKD